MKGSKALLLSLPWHDYHCPALSIGTLAAFAKERGFDVKAMHLHLPLAADLGLARYDEICGLKFVGEALFASILFPENRQRLIAFAEKRMAGVSLCAPVLKRSLVGAFKGIKWSDYELIGFTISYDQLFASLLLARWIKDMNPRVKILFGGRQVAGKLGASVLENFSQVDWCLDGEGEESLVRIMEELVPGSPGFERGVQGLIFRKGDGVKRNSRGRLMSLKGLPDPDFSHFLECLQRIDSTQGTQINPHIPVEVSRGCVNSCAFCGEHIFYGPHRPRPHREVADSIDRLSRSFKGLSFFLVAQIITPACCMGLSPILKAHGRDYMLYCEVPATLAAEHLKKLKESGVTEALIGMEALDSTLLKKMDKPSRFIDVLNALKLFEELGMIHNSNLILGFPTESQADIDRSVANIDYACSYRPPAKLENFVLCEGSPVYLDPLRYGIRDVSHEAGFAKLLRAYIPSRLKLWQTDFSRSRRPSDYSALDRRLRLWAGSYFEARSLGIPLLHMLDAKDFLRIEDRRFGERSLTLTGLDRELYLFCRRIRSFKEISARFSMAGKGRLRRRLGEFSRLKVMYTEDRRWLSLATHAEPGVRYNMIFD